MKNRIYIGISCAVILFLSGCFNYDKEAEELTEYYNGWLILRSEEPTLDLLIEVESAKDTARKHQLIKEKLLPAYKESLEYLKNVELDYKEIQQLNELHINAEKFGLEMYEEINDVLKEAIRIGNNHVSDTTDELYKLERKIREFNEKRDELMEKYKLYWIIDYDEYGNELELIGRDR